MISIIIPSYNNLELLQKCILSIKNQTFKDYEVWIIDNQSNDGTKEYLKTLSAPFNWVHEKDDGVYDAMNKGISLATKEWFYFLGTDDVLHHEKVLATVFSTSIQDEYKIMLGNIQYDLKSGDKIYTHTPEGLVRPSWSMKLWIKNSVHHQGIFYRRELFLSTGYDIQYKVLADYAFNLNLYSKKVEAKLLNIVIALCGANGLSKRRHTSQLLYNKEEVKLKSNLSSNLLRPLFIVTSTLKYIFKKL